MKLVARPLAALYLTLLMSPASGTETTTTHPDGTTTTTAEETTGTQAPATTTQHPAPVSPAAGRKLIGPAGATGTVRHSIGVRIAGPATPVSINTL